VKRHAGSRTYWSSWLYYVWPPEVAKTFEAEKFVVSISQPTSICMENIGTRSRMLFSERVRCMLSPVRLSSVCNVRAP